MSGDVASLDRFLVAPALDAATARDLINILEGLAATEEPLEGGPTRSRGRRRSGVRSGADRGQATTEVTRML